jgi:hypothetical protein
MRKKVVSPAHRRTLAQEAVEAGLCSQRAACRILGLARSTYGFGADRQRHGYENRLRSLYAAGSTFAAASRS